ncbi:tetratricopeptide repeat protein [Sphingomonas adhaesiva]|uniref:tetratricopeptide repeat protein n=1 Tax=Sphingomonas adhaesiva TaxID=28212 RepID=UPI002FF99C61
MTRSAPLFAAALAVAAVSPGAAPAFAAAGADIAAAYARARIAEAAGDLSTSTRAYATALDAAPADVALALRAYREGVRGGDMALADRAAAILTARGVAPNDAGLLAVAKAAQAGDLPAARTAVAALGTGPMRIFAPSLKAWIAVEARQADPLSPLDAPGNDVVARRLARETRALVLLATGQTAPGLAALRAVLGNDQAAQDNRLAAARLLVARGESAAAETLLTGDAPAIVALRARPEGRDASLAFGTSHLFARVASDLALGAPGPMSFALTRAALRADPRNDRARLLLASALAKDGALDAALATLAEIPGDSIHARAAAAGRAQLLAEADRPVDALAAARAAAAAPDATSSDIRRLADLYLAAGEGAAAVPLYRSLVERAGDAADGTDWLQLGAALDRAGRWPEARAALERAHALSPDDPLVLNYLGYSLVDHGERLAEAQAMLERAAARRPDDPAIIDSLGWALHRRGQSARALPLLERAAAASPGDPEVGEHLGDLYWQAGRRYEARYAWRAARVEAEGDVAARLDRKIADGL